MAKILKEKAAISEVVIKLSAEKAEELQDVLGDTTGNKAWGVYGNLAEVLDGDKVTSYDGVEVSPVFKEGGGEITLQLSSEEGQYLRDLLGRGVTYDSPTRELHISIFRALSYRFPANTGKASAVRF